MSDSGHSSGIADANALERTGSPEGARDSLTSAPPSQTRKKAEKPPLPRRLCSLADAARYLAVSDWTVRQMIWRGDLPHIKTGKRVLLDLRDLDGWIEREKVRGS